MFDFLKNKFLYKNKYRTHSEAVIIACYFNPQGSQYRHNAFIKFYESIKHLNHQILECVIGDAEPILPEDNPNISRVYTKNLLWHKESLLNKLVSELPAKYKYVFWLDTDVLFTNLNWLPESVEVLQTEKLVQPFEFCFHLNQDEVEPDVMIRRNLENIKTMATNPRLKHPRVWRSFAANWTDKKYAAVSNIYDQHGHVGFAWGAKREVLDAIPLYDKALIGGADHIIAHAAVGQLDHECIKKSFYEDLEEVKEWSKRFFAEVGGRLGYVQGDLYHIWHGDIEKRQYLKRIIDFTPKAKKITKRDENGLYVTDDEDTLAYMMNYYIAREVMDLDDCCEEHRHHNCNDHNHHGHHHHHNDHERNEERNNNNVSDSTDNNIIPAVMILDSLQHEQHSNDHNSTNDNFS